MQQQSGICMITNVLKVTHQAGGLQARGGSIDSSHSRHRLVVVDEPLSADQQFWCIRNQILLTEDKVHVQNFNYFSRSDA